MFNLEQLRVKASKLSEIEQQLRSEFRQLVSKAKKYNNTAYITLNVEGEPILYKAKVTLTTYLGAANLRDYTMEAIIKVKPAMNTRQHFVTYSPNLEISLEALTDNGIFEDILTDNNLYLTKEEAMSSTAIDYEVGSTSTYLIALKNSIIKDKKQLLELNDIKIV